MNIGKSLIQNPANTVRHANPPVYDKILQANKAKDIYKIVSEDFNKELNGNPGFLRKILSTSDSTGRSIEQLISQKLLEIDKASTESRKGLRVLHRINVLIKYLLLKSPSVAPYLLKDFSIVDTAMFLGKIGNRTKEIRNERLLLAWVKDSTKPDLSQNQLDKLEELHQGFFVSINPFLLEFSQLRSVLNEEMEIQGGYITSLLHYAIETKKPNIVKYLISIGANIHGVVVKREENDYRSVFLKVIDWLEST